jgi:hypothetical protein
VKSVTTERFRRQYAAAGAERQRQIRKAYALWRTNPWHPSLRFKKVHSSKPIYSARVDLDWRALCVLDNETIIWFWVGPHGEYEDLLRKA